MQILVTGCAGFIGSHLCETLLARGDTVVGVDNFDAFYPRDAKEANLEPSIGCSGFMFAELDLRDQRALDRWWRSEKMARRLDAVVHLAAKAGVRPSIADPIGYQRANILATNHLLECIASEENDRTKFVFASSSSVYGNNPKVPFSETDCVDYPISPYAQTKKSCELLCHTYHHLHDIDTFCLRFFTVYGPRQRPDLAIQKFTARILAGSAIDMFGSGDSSRDYTYIDDIIDGVVKAIDRCRGYETINIGSTHPITLKEMIETVEEACERKATILQKPMQPGDVNRTFADVSKAAQLLDYQPTTPFADGVRAQVAWYKRRER